MRAKMQNLTRLIRRQIYAPISALFPATSEAEQTRSSWAKPVESFAAVPAAYQSFFEPFLAAGRAFPFAVLTPTYEGFVHRTTEKLVCDLGREICVLEKSGTGFEAQCYPLEELSYIEVRTVLLDSRIKIAGMTKQGVPASSTFRFNSVTDYLFAPMLERIRLAIAAPRGAPSTESVDPGRWVRVNFKFMNYAKRSLLPGEKILHAVLQPEIRANVLAVLGRTYSRTISPTHMCLLTDRELITIREEAVRGGEERYGGIWDFIPLSKVAALSLDRKGGDWRLSIQLREGPCLEGLFQASAREEVEKLVHRFEALTTGVQNESTAGGIADPARTSP